MKLTAKKLGKTYDGQAILEDIDFSVESGQSVAFMSPSGSGKSTLLSMLGLLLTPSVGTITIDDMDVKTLSDKEVSGLRCDNFGFVFQHTQLIGSLRAWENVQVPANFLKLVPCDTKDRAIKLLEQVGLGERVYHYPHQLSIGQKRRVATARALLLDPPIIIADEPTNDLDTASAKSVTDILFERVTKGSILLFATHDEELASKATKIMRLEGKAFVESRS